MGGDADHLEKNTKTLLEQEREFNEIIVAFGRHSIVFIFESRY